MRLSLRAERKARVFGFAHILSHSIDALHKPAVRTGFYFHLLTEIQVKRCPQLINYSHTKRVRTQ